MFRSVLKRTVKIGDYVTITKDGFEYSGEIVHQDLASSRDAHMVIDDGAGKFHVIEITNCVVTIEGSIVNPGDGKTIEAKVSKKSSK